MQSVRFSSAYRFQLNDNVWKSSLQESQNRRSGQQWYNSIEQF